MRKTIMHVLMVGAAVFVAVVGQGDANSAALAAAPAPTSKAASERSDSTAATPEQLKREKGNASARMQQDRRRFPRQDISDAEALYQVANKNWRSAEATESLQKMIAKYPQFNRTGCGILYLGQMSEGDARIKYLTEAVEKHSDCYYMNGVQVGAFGRYLLAHTYLDQGKNAEAQKLFDEIRKDYRNAVTHRGDSLIAVMNEEGKTMKAGTQPSAE
jgi:TolA-binding protein